MSVQGLAAPIAARLIGSFRSLRRTALLLRYGIKTCDQPFVSLGDRDQTTTGLLRYARLWRRFQAIIELIDTCTIEKFQPFIAKYAHALQSSGLLVRPAPIALGQSLLCERIGGWTIPPHINDLPQIIQSMIYFPSPGSSEDQGTMLYRLRRPVTLESAKLFATYCFASDDIEPTCMMPYRLNTLASFLNTPLSIHSTPEVTSPSRRYIFTGSTWPRECFNPEVGHIDLNAFREG